MEEKFKSKYHRSSPIRDFDINQTLYEAVINTNEKNANYKYASFLKRSKNYKYLKNEADKLSTALKHDGVKDGDKVGVCLLTVPEVDTVLLGVNKLGAQSCWMAANSSPEDMVKYIKENNIKELIISSPLKPLIDNVINQTNLQRVILVSPINFLCSILTKFKKYEDDRYIDYANFINVENDKSIKCAKYDKEKPTLSVQSSGSTGKSKTIVHTDYNFNSEILKMAYADLPFFEKKKAFVCAPPWVIYGLVNSIYSGLIFGMETVFSLKPEENMIYKNMGNFNLVYGVPVYYRYLYDKIMELEKSDKLKDKKELQKLLNQLDKIEVFISGGDKIAEEELIKWQQKFRTPIVNGYGNNEVVGAAIVSPMFANKPGSIGVPMYGINAKTFDPDTEEMLEDGKLGELYINSDSLFTEYLNNPEETNNIKTTAYGKDWVKTGDLAYIDKDGYVHLKGRTRRLIIDKLGYKISPDNIENVISNLEYVKECVVVGVEVAENDMVPYAFVELNDEYKNNEQVLKIIEEECIKKLKDYEIPKFIKEEKIPHKENGGKRDFLLLEQMAKENIKAKQKTLKK